MKPPRCHYLYLSAQSFRWSDIGEFLSTALLLPPTTPRIPLQGDLYSPCGRGTTWLVELYGSEEDYIGIFVVMFIGVKLHATAFVNEQLRMTCE